MKIVNMKRLLENDIEFKIPTCKCGKEMKIEAMTFCNCEVVVDGKGNFVSTYGRYRKPESVAFICECGKMMNYIRGDK